MEARNATELLSKVIPEVGPPTPIESEYRAVISQADVSTLIANPKPAGVSMVEWTPYTNSVSASPMWLMQDGTVLGCTDGQTLKFLNPDSKGSYANGTWSDAGQFLLVKDNFASAVLPDGRLVVCGGEQSGQGLPTNDTNFCEIYDPLKKNIDAVCSPARLEQHR